MLRRSQSLTGPDSLGRTDCCTGVVNDICRLEREYFGLLAESRFIKVADPVVGPRALTRIVSGRQIAALRRQEESQNP
jgi:hypothetical protein